MTFRDEECEDRICTIVDFLPGLLEGSFVCLSVVRLALCTMCPSSFPFTSVGCASISVRALLRGLPSRLISRRNARTFIGGPDFANGARSSLAAAGPPPPMHGTPDLRTGQVFHGLPTYPSAATAAGVSGGPSMPPSLQAGGFDTVGRHSVATAARRADVDGFDAETDARDHDNAALFGSLPEGKRRKFILVDDPQRGCRVRVKVMLDQVDMNEIPDSYRLSNAVYPRAYFPVQMKSSPGRVVPGKRFFEDENDDDEDGSATVGRTLVPVLSPDRESDTAVPRLSRGRNRKEMVLNDLGYRMSWSQSRVFAGRTMFLQRSRGSSPSSHLPGRRFRLPRYPHICGATA